MLKGMNLATLVRYVGVLAWLSFLYGLMMGVWMNTQKDAKPDLKGKGTHVFQKPVLALEFARDDAEVAGVIGSRGDERRPAVRDYLLNVLRLDYGFIALHLLLFSGLALVLSRGGAGASGTLAVVVALCAVGLAASNVLQNVRLARVVEAAGLVADVRTLGYLKWGFTFAAVGLLSYAFRGAGWWPLTLMFALCLLVACVGAVGLVAASFKSGEWPLLWLIELAFLLTGLLLACVAVIFTFWPQRVAGALGPP